MRISVWFAFVLVLSSPLGLAQTADIVLYNGKVVTVDSQFTITEAVAVRSDRILAVGKNDDVLGLAGDATEKIDLKGRMVIPGLIDSHRHVHSEARRQFKRELAEYLPEYPINWATIKTKIDFLAQIEQTMKTHKFKPGEWVFFPAANYNDSPTAIRIFHEELTAADLDKVTPNNPIALSIGGGTIVFDGIAMTNGKGLAILWSKYGNFIEKYGRYWKNPGGKPTGMLEPPASKIIQHELLPKPAAEFLVEIQRKGLETISAMGVTTVSSRMGHDAIEAYRLLDDANQLKVRMAYANEDFFAVEDPEATFGRMGNLIGTGSSKLWLTSITPTIVDGTRGRGATDLPRLTSYGADGKYFPIGASLLDTEYRGATENYYRDWFFALARNGLRQSGTHAQGDRSVRRMLDIMEEINEEIPLKDMRWALDHCTMVNPQDIPRSVKLGVLWSCAPKYIETSAPTIEEVYGEEVANTFVVPIKTMLDAGAKVVLETDRAVYIWSEIELALTRKALNGKVYGPQERIDKPTALKMFTSWAAEYVLREKELGSLEPGKKADIAVLDRDYLTISDEEVSQVRVLMTICDGEIVYLHPEFSKQHQLEPEGAVIATYRDLLNRR